MRAAAAVTVSVLALLAVGGSLALTPASSGGALWDDDGPDGHARLAQALSERAKVRALEGSLALLPPEAGEGDTLFAFTAGRAVEPSEVSAVVAFVEQGGTLVLATDTPGTGSLAPALGVWLHGVPAVRLHGEGCVRTEIPVPPQPLAVCLPSPSAFPGALLQTTEVNLSFASHSADPLLFDLDGDGVLDMGDQAPDRPPVAVGWSHGRGRVVAIADADLWRNRALVEAPGNTALATALLDGSGTAYLDSTGGEANQAQRVHSAWLNAMADKPWRAWPSFALVAAAGLLAAVAPRLSPWSPHRPDPEASDPEVDDQARQALLRSLVDARRPETSEKTQGEM